jgi:hypothetical protein
MKIFAYLVMLVIVFIYIEEKMTYRACKFPSRYSITTSTVTSGLFSQTIPLTGTIVNDSVAIVFIDQLYFGRIAIGLRAITTLNNKDLDMHLISRDSSIADGRFSALMQLDDDTSLPPPGKNIRLRLSLSDPQLGLLLPVGGFYKDTRGEWVFVTTDGEHFTKRTIKLGPKSPEHFLVLEGLHPGEKVLTSSYEGFAHKNSVTLWEIELQRPISLM